MLTDAVALSQDLIRIPSVNPPGAEKACADVVARHLSELDFSVNE